MSCDDTAKIISVGDGNCFSIFLVCRNCGSPVEKKKFSSPFGRRATNAAISAKSAAVSASIHQCAPDQLVVLTMRQTYPICRAGQRGSDQRPVAASLCRGVSPERRSRSAGPCLHSVRGYAIGARLRIELRFRHGRAEGSVGNLNFGPDGNRIEKLGDILGAHPNATVARRTADQPLFRSAMDVNVTRVSPGVLLFQTTQPENAAHDRIASGGIWLEDFAGRLAILEHRAERGVRADLGRDGHRAEGRSVSSVAVAETKLRGRDAIPRDDHAVIDQGQRLIGDADHDGGLGEGGRRADNRRSQTNKRDDAALEKPHTAAYKAAFMPPAAAGDLEPW